MFQDDGNGDAEIVQENHFYSFGLEMNGNWNQQTNSEQNYLFSNNELQKDYGLGVYDFVNRTYDPTIGRFWQLDDLAEAAPDWTPYRYSFNNPIRFIDPDGLFETEAEAKKYAQDNNIKTGGIFGIFRNNKIKEQSDGTFAIENRKEHTSTSDLGEDFGVMTASMVAATDVMSIETEGNMLFGHTMTATNRDGSETDMTPVGGTVPTPGSLRVPKGEFWVKVIGGKFAKKGQKGGTFISRTAKYFKSKLFKKGDKIVKPPKTSTSKGPRDVDRDMEELIKNWGRFVKDHIDDLSGG